jgi:hypothetical protein
MKAVVLDPEGYRHLSIGQALDAVFVGCRSVVVRSEDGRNAVLMLQSVRLVAEPDREPEERSDESHRTAR